MTPGTAFRVGGGLTAALGTVLLAYLVWSNRGAELAGVGVLIAGGGFVGLVGFAQYGSGSTLTPATQAARQASQSNLVRDILAIFVVFGSMGTIVYLAVWVSIPSSQSFAAIVTGILGGVVGYYFGTKAVADVQATAGQAVEQTTFGGTRASATLIAAAQARETQVQQELTQATEKLQAAKGAFSFRGKVLDAATSDDALRQRLESLLDSDDLG